jgi:hypothetical protein
LAGGKVKIHSIHLLPGVRVSVQQGMQNVFLVQTLLKVSESYVLPFICVQEAVVKKWSANAATLAPDGAFLAPFDKLEPIFDMINEV